MLGWCAENGIDRYDMLAPRSRNKGEWQSGEVAVLDFALPMTLGGRLYLQAVLERLAPALRNAFYALPAPLRSIARRPGAQDVNGLTSMQIAAEFRRGRALQPETRALGPEIARGAGFQVEVVSSRSGLDAIAARMAGARSPLALPPRFSKASRMSGSGRATSPAEARCDASRRGGARGGPRRPDPADGGLRLRCSPHRTDRRRPDRAIFRAAPRSVACLARQPSRLRLPRSRMQASTLSCSAACATTPHLLRLAAPHLRPPMARTVAPFADLSAFPTSRPSERLSPRGAARSSQSPPSPGKAGAFRFEISRAAQTPGRPSPRRST